MPARAGARCPRNSIDMLNNHMQACAFPKADIVTMAKRLRDDTAPPPPSADRHDAAGLKVEKNALALVFIPAVMTMAEEFVEAHPGVVFNVLLGQLGMVDLSEVRAGIDPRNPQASICNNIHYSLGSMFQHLVHAYVLALADAARDDPQLAWTVENLLERYRRVVSDYHGHTEQSAQNFTPQGHIMAGINTALFIILRALSAIAVLGEAKLGRPPTREDLAVAMKNSTPLLLTVARCHLEQLLELEGPLGKQEDLFFSRLDAQGYTARLAEMFTLTQDAEGLRLELAEDILVNLPVMTSTKPRTGCPALYASTFDNVNAIVALVRMTERAFAELHFAP